MTQPTRDPLPDSTLSRLQRRGDLTLDARVAQFDAFLARQLDDGLLVAREIVSPVGREVLVRDAATGQVRPMRMFGSNNYLGLAAHPHVIETVRQSLARWAVGLAGPPLLNGTTSEHVRLEQRVAALKGKDAAILFSSGFAANLGWLAGLAHRDDLIVADELCHASIFDGARLSEATLATFRHNDVADLAERLAAAREPLPANLFVVVEGVYGMDGDLAPLAEIAPLCKRHGAFLAVDDAHGTGVLGARGGGSAEHFGVEADVDLAMGTFSKALAASGAFVAAREVVQYLRFNSRPYFFSAAMPPVTLAAIHGGLDVIEREPQRRRQLHANVAALVERLRAAGLATASQSAVVPVRVPRRVRAVGRRLHEAGLFVNAVEYPAVPQHTERFRISVTSEHTTEDLDALATGLVAALRAEGIAPEECV